MNQEKNKPWLTPVLNNALQGSYIYPSSYPAMLSSASNSLDPPPLDGELKATDLPSPGYCLRGYTREPLARLAAAPFVRPSRGFLLYVPASYREYEAAPLVVWLHGCRQSAEEFRDGSRITQWADQRGFVVLMPRQSKWANPLGCWNWFDQATQNGVGETALIIAQARFIRSRWNIDPDRVWIAGMSSGAALAACIAVHAKSEFRAAAFVSGLANGAASSAATAAKVMTGPTDVDVTDIAHRASLKKDSQMLRSLIIHGDEDEVAAPTHADELARQMLALNGEAPVLAPLRPPDRRTKSQAGERKVVRDQFKINDQDCVEILRVAGLGHAWSGGDASFAFNDPLPPDATQIILDFFANPDANFRPAPIAQAEP
jgi:poly(hydroxyalkanoate) depolymerase family esterase